MCRLASGSATNDPTIQRSNDPRRVNRNNRVNIALTGSLVRFSPRSLERVLGSLDGWIVGSLDRWIVGSLGVA
jgi:hypothetical protein